MINDCDTAPEASPELLARLFDRSLSDVKDDSVMQFFRSCWLRLIALDPLIRLFAPQT